jgi:hypothetical protein
MNYATLYAVLGEISNDMCIRITGSLARKWAIDIGVSRFDEEKRRWKIS